LRLRILLITSILIAGAVVFGARSAHGGWVADGSSVCPACGNNIYRDPSLAADGAGGLYACWFGAPFLLRVQHLLANGDLDPGWPAMGVAPTGLTGMNYRSRVMPDGAGGVFMTWLATGCVAHCASFEEGRVYVQRIAPSGAISPGWPADGVKLGSEPVTEYPLIEPDGFGGALIASHQIPFTPTSPIRVTRVNAAGVIQWPASFAGGHVAPNSSELEDSPTLAADGVGGAFVAWTDRRGSIPQIYLQHFDSAGNIADSSGVAVTAAALAQRRPKLLADGSGGVFLAWEDSTAGALRDIRAQRFNALLQPKWGSGVGVTPGAAGDQRFVALTLDQVGGLFLVWMDGPSGSARIAAQRLDGNGQVVPPWPADGEAIHTGTAGYKAPNIVVAPAGGFYASWDHVVTIATHVQANGTPAPGIPPAGISLCPGNCGSIETGTYLAADGLGGALALWDDFRPTPDSLSEFEQSFAAKIGETGIVATLASLVSADVSQRVVRLEWRLSEAATLDVERAEAADGAAAAWSPFTRVTSDASGRLIVEDGAVRAGARYGYRLVQRYGANASILAQTWVTVPLEDELSLAGARPNPSSGDVQLAFTLRDGSPATLELLDITGRRVASRRLESLGPGAHVERFDEAARLPAGIYTARLAQGGRAVTTHVTLVR